MRTTTGAAKAPSIYFRFLHATWIWPAIIAFTLPLLFAAFTHHIWEDYYITFRASKNLAEGHGLVYQIGERVHSFTSPLGVLLPAFFSFLTRSDLATIWCFRVLNCAALAMAVILLWQLLTVHGISKLTRWFVTLFLIGESKLVDFTINGMETALMVLACAALLKLILQPVPPKPLSLGCTLAALMWIRPDGFVIGSAIIASALTFKASDRRAVKDSLSTLIRAAGWATLMYAPWFIWAWWYYGTPVPHTIAAKSGIAETFSWDYLLSAPITYASGGSRMDWLLNPSYFFFGGWPDLLIKTNRLLAILAGFLWLLPTLHRVLRISSLALFFGSFYLLLIPAFPWYFPVWHLLAAITLGGAAGSWVHALGDTPWRRGFARGVIALVVGTQFLTVGASAWQVRQQQTIIEDSGREELGRWLAAHASKGDTVMLEPLGYIGYFSQLHMLDFLALSAPSVLAARRDVGKELPKLVDRLNPTWLILRPVEKAQWSDQGSDGLSRYALVKITNALERVEAVPFLPGRGLLGYDAVYLVYHRRADAPR